MVDKDFIEKHQLGHLKVFSGLYFVTKNYQISLKNNKIDFWIRYFRWQPN
jgi:hypothetical protein